MFRLRKWYLDCVAPSGAGAEAFIGYWARLDWGALRLGYASALHAPARGQLAESHTFLPGRGPALSSQGVRWSCRRLGISAAWHRAAPPVRRTLLDSPAGRIDWDCLLPAGPARLRLPGDGLGGLGYVERLELTCEPWKLPFSTLHWGRFLAPGASLVWIVWEGDEAAPAAASPAPSSSADGALPGGTRWAFRDAEAVELVQFSPSRLVTRQGAEEAVLELECARVLRAGPVVSPALRSVAALATRIPSPFLMAREEKWLSRGRLEDPRRKASIRGWAIHEIVRFR